MLKKNIGKEELEKIKKEILQALGKTFNRPDLFEKWPCGRMLVTDALSEFFEIARKDCLNSDKKTKVSIYRTLKLTEKIFDKLNKFSHLPFVPQELSYNKFAEAFNRFIGISPENTELVISDGDDLVDEEDIGHEPFAH